MATNPVFDTIHSRASVRRYRDEMPDEEVVAAIVRAGQRAPFAMQMGSVVLKRGGRNPWSAPLRFVVLADVHRLEAVAARRGRRIQTNDLDILLFAIQDAALMAQTMVIAAEALGLGSCYLGVSPTGVEKLVEECGLPPRVFPLVQLVMGYPAEEPTPRPRYPLSFGLFEERYPELTEETVEEAMEVMDRGFLEQGYYARGRLKLPRPEEGEDPFTFEDYSWTEHISRKLHWNADPAERIEALRRCGFDLTRPS